MTAPDLIAAIATLVLLCCSYVVKPKHARCPDKHDLRTGIRPSGSFECWPNPVGSPEYDGTYGHPDRSRQSTAVVRSKIWCTSGSSPIVVNERAVGCQR